MTDITTAKGRKGGRGWDGGTEGVHPKERTREEEGSTCNEKQRRREGRAPDGRTRWEETIFTERVSERERERERQRREDD